MKRTDDPRILADPRARYMLLVEAAMADLLPSFERLDPPITYHTHFGDFSGRAEDMTIWFGFADRRRRQEAERNGLVQRVRDETKAALRGKGYPESALASMLINFTSLEEIAEGGGEFRYFRSF